MKRIIFSCLLVLTILGTVNIAVAAQDATQLEQENAQLQRQVRRLEAQVAAMREELNRPDAGQIGGGIGYIVGIFGVAAWLAARKKQPRGN